MIADRGVTVVVPTRDRPELLAATVASVLAQRDANVHVVVVDDGSARPPALPPDPRIVVLRNDVSRGVSAARNRGLEAVRTPWTAFCDDDDLWAPTKLHEQLEAMAATGAAWSYTGAVHVDETLRVVDVQRPLPAAQVVVELQRFNVVPGGGSSVVAQTSLLRAVGGFDVTLSQAADWDLWLRLAAADKPAEVDAPLVAYRRHAGGMSGNARAIVDELPALQARTQGRVDTAAFLRWVAGIAIQRRQWWSAFRWLVEAGRREGRGPLRAASGALHRAYRAALHRDEPLVEPNDPWVDSASAWLRALPVAAPAPA